MNNRIEKQIEIAAPVTRVWRALTDSKEFGEWFRVKLEGPFVAGQPVSGQLTWPGYEHPRMELFVKTIEPENYFSYTWHPYAIDPTVDYSQETPTLVEFRLVATAGGTLVTVTESGFEKLPSTRQEIALLRNESGWQQQMGNIKAYVDKAA
jgi:uncharacterized protein YndB with AHSA1/START domain